MKKTCDGREVPDRCYYYLLDWKDKSNSHIKTKYGKDSLHELNFDEFWDFFEYATKVDLLNRKNKK